MSDNPDKEAHGLLGQNQSRRNFLKTAAALAGNAALADAVVPSGGLAKGLMGFFKRRTESSVNSLSALLELSKSFADTDKNLLDIGNSRFDVYREDEAYRTFTDEQITESSKAFYDDLRPKIHRAIKQLKQIRSKLAGATPEELEEFLDTQLPKKMLKQAWQEAVTDYAKNGKVPNISYEEFVEFERAGYLRDISTGSTSLTGVTDENLREFSTEELTEKIIDYHKRDEIGRHTYFRNEAQKFDRMIAEADRRIEAKNAAKREVEEHFGVGTVDAIRRAKPRILGDGYILHFDVPSARHPSERRAGLDQFIASIEAAFDPHEVHLRPEGRERGILVIECQSGSDAAQLLDQLVLAKKERASSRGKR